jgi:hypothetical protein
MKAIKYLSQILAALIYTPLYTGIMYLVIVLPVLWIVHLSTWKMIVAFIFLGAILEGIITILQVLGLIPFTWIVKNNRVSLLISVAACVLLPLYNIVSLFMILSKYGDFGICTAFVLTGFLVQFIYMSVIGIIGIKGESNGNS